MYQLILGRSLLHCGSPRFHPRDQGLLKGQISPRRTYLALSLNIRGAVIILYSEVMIDLMMMMRGIKKSKRESLKKHEMSFETEKLRN